MRPGTAHVVTTLAGSVAHGGSFFYRGTWRFTLGALLDANIYWGISNEFYDRWPARIYRLMVYYCYTMLPLCNQQLAAFDEEGYERLVSSGKQISRLLHSAYQGIARRSPRC
jgi:hypothetical protein